MRNRPTKVDRWLTRHPKHREAIIAKAGDMGYSVGELANHLNRLGAKVSKSGVWRWRSRYIRPALAAGLREQVMRQVLDCDLVTLQGLTTHLNKVSSKRRESCAQRAPFDGGPIGVCAAVEADS